LDAGQQRSVNRNSIDRWTTGHTSRTYPAVGAPAVQGQVAMPWRVSLVFAIAVSPKAIIAAPKLDAFSERGGSFFEPLYFPRIDGNRRLILSL
jgi:hypothetical protein